MARIIGSKPSVLLRYGGLVAAVALMSACHHKDAAPKPAPAPAKPASSAIAQTPTPIRQKPDFGGVGTEHVEATATGPTLEVAIDHAIRLAVEQVNGKTIAGGGASLDIGGSLTADGQHMDYKTSQYAGWLATRTSGVVTNFRIISQTQISHPLSTDEESLKATKGASWNKGNVDTSQKQSASYSDKSSANADARADGVGEASASAQDNQSVSASEQSKASGEWDQHQGAQSVDYKKKHTEFAHEWQVTVGADVAKYHESAAAKLTRVVIALPRSSQTTFRVGDNSIPADRVATQIRTELTDALTQTPRFTVLDRDANAEMGQEIELIQSGNAKPADAARLGHQLATDLIVIPTINHFDYLRHERALHLSGRTLVSYSGGGSLSFRVVNATTGQIVLSQTFDYSLPDTAPTTLGASADGVQLASEMMGSLDHQIVEALLQSTFPLSVVQRNGRNVVINQGGEAVTEGATYQAVTMGADVVDPQSGQSLGPTETPCCTVKIDRITPNLSYGHIVEANVDVSGAFTPGSMELREQVHEAKAASPPIVLAKQKRAHVPKKSSTPKEKPRTKDDNW
jgi:curli biogenesis system outer membrane secretion channel CsgG